MLESSLILHERYQLQQQLSDNPVRQTWLAQDQVSQDLVVVKLLAFGGQMQWDDLKLFEREAQVLQQLDHPKIPKYRDYFSIENQGLWFGLIYDYIPGVSLKQVLETQKAFSEEELRQFATDILEILVYLHNFNPPILHRDIKPSNLILGEDQRIYLVDFGAVQNRGIPNAGVTYTVVGTYGYTPIEQYGGQAVPASDLYALGATLIHLLTGIAPADLPQRELRLQFKDSVHAEISSQLIRWIEHLTEPALERRMNSAQQALEVLKNGLTQYIAGTDITELENTKVVVNKTPETLEISIPARVEIEVIEPCKQFLIRTASSIKQGISKLLENAKGSGTLTKETILWRLGIAAGILLVVNLSFPIIVYSTHLIVLSLQSLIFIAILLFLGNWISRRRSYFERTYVCFDAKKFVIEWQQVWFYNYRRQVGLTPEITEVSVAPYYADPNQKSYPPQLGVVVNAGSRQQPEEYGFGQELTEAELKWLMTEIEEWLRNYS